MITEHHFFEISNFPAWKFCIYKNPIQGYTFLQSLRNSAKTGN